VKSEFDENESRAAPPDVEKPDDKESQLELPEDLNLDDAAEADADEDEDENTAADNAECGFYICCSTSCY